MENYRPCPDASHAEHADETRLSRRRNLSAALGRAVEAGATRCPFSADSQLSLGRTTTVSQLFVTVDAKAPRVPGVYAFVVDDVVVYVGLTKSGLHRRFEQYRRGHKRQRTRARFNDRIASTLAAAKRVKVLVASPEPSEWNGLPVDTAAGLEERLIERIGPIWNIMGVR
jgi:hypothetical protein